MVMSTNGHEIYTNDFVSTYREDQSVSFTNLSRMCLEYDTKMVLIKDGLI